jgi:Flp pilus assembly protein TadG
MSLRTLVAPCLAQLRAFRHSQRGNVAMTFALAAIPLVGLTGAAVDYSRGNSAKVAMQAAMDATALMLAKEVHSLTEAQLQQKAEQYFKANFNRPEAQNVKITPSFTNTGGTKLTLTASATIPTVFSSLIGKETMEVSASTVAKWGTTRLRVALVLDTTGSMQTGDKIGALKTATKNFLTQLQSAAVNNGDVYVSIVPFSRNVNVGRSNYTQTWVDFTEWEAEPEILDTAKGGAKPNNWAQIGPNSTCPFTTSNHGFRCVSSAQGTSNVSSVPSSGLICPGRDGGQRKSWKIGVIYNGCYTSTLTQGSSTGSSAACPSDTNSYLSGTNGTSNTCSCSGSGASRRCTWNYYTHVWRGSTAAAPARSTWTGCVTDRGAWNAPSGDYDRKVDSPNINVPASLFPAQQDYYCSPPVMGLNYDWTAMNALADSLYPNGATNQPIGLVWGWQSLVGGGPFTVPAKDSNYQYNEVIVLMSDGLNTLDRWYGNGSATNTNVDKRMYDGGVGTCKNVKDAGITIYAIHFNTTGDPMSQLLRNCASSADKFFMVTSNSEFISLFEKIGTELSKLRIAY